MQQMLKIVLLSLSILLVGCSSIANKLGIKSRNTEYLQSANSSLIHAPADVSLPQPEQYYLVAKTSGPSVAAANSLLLPPGSPLASQAENLPVDLELLIPKPTNYIIDVQPALIAGEPHIKINQGLTDTWNAVALALQASHYTVLQEDNQQGNFTVISPDKAERYVLHLAIEGKWQGLSSMITVVPANGSTITLSYAQRRSVVKSLGESLKQVTQVPAANLLVTTMTYGEANEPILLLNRDLAWTLSSVENSLLDANYKIIKRNLEQAVYIIADTNQTKGILRDQTPLYSVVIRSNNAISKVLIIDEKNKFASNETANRILNTIANGLAK